MNTQRLSLNPASFKTRFTRLFLQALARLNRPNPGSSASSASSLRDFFRRQRKVKAAADASMACAAGARRAWSRALLRKCRQRLQRRRALGGKIGMSTVRKRSEVGNKGWEGIGSGSGQAHELRRLVPGGQAMEFHALVREAAHYIKCLNAQIEAMRSIADLYSALAR
ncbi:transcription factor IBH1-like [Malania oleifera]|uniref:transcription factor IBH1-like n=1 Tax=Malania oleifera TaxID=397392 RepID=UPI0025AEAFED|nr:transcription factor IBH1-like [Malania oleifera]